MLSPKATNDMALKRGAGRTWTDKEQVSVRCSASVAEHVTAVWPTGNCAPLSGVQLTMTGDAPLTTVAAP
jgi:hypothetical protein